jgi:WhiB family transcriptional regulator, redox-sensing transcriptional regulator
VTLPDHATRADYLAGCRTPECRAANTLYEQKRQRRKAPPFVAAGRARTHVRELQAAGMSMKAIAKRAGVPRTVLHRLLGSCCGYGKSRHIRPETESAILAVHPDVVTPAEPRHAARTQVEPWFIDIEPVPAGTDMTWRTRRACTEVPVHVFFPGRGDIELVRAAQAICADCEVREPCLAFALSVPETTGIWGGTTERQREKMLGRRGGLGREEAVA